MEGTGAEIFLIIVAIITFIFFVVTAPWIYSYFTSRNLYQKDFEKLSAQAQVLAEKTIEVKIDVNKDNTAAECIKITNQELAQAAEEWDNGIRTALAAWDDFIEMQRIETNTEFLDLEKQPQRKIDDLAKQRKKHARFMIKFMRAKVLEGISQREELSIQLQKVHLAVKSRGSKLEAAQANLRLGDRREIKDEKLSEPEADASSFSSSTTYTPSNETSSIPSLDSINIAPGTMGMETLFNRPPSRAATAVNPLPMSVRLALDT